MPSRPLPNPFADDFSPQAVAEARVKAAGSDALFMQELERLPLSEAGLADLKRLYTVACADRDAWKELSTCRQVLDFIPGIMELLKGRRD